ncbi:MAG: helix-turn-helix transcriptional regulator [Massiliimalia sp.]
MKLGETISSIRKNHNMTQEEFAQIFHVTRQTISHWETEKSYPDLQTLVRISDRFQISLDTMLKEDTAMVQTMDRDIAFSKLIRKYTRPLLALLLSAAAAVLIAGVIYGGVWSSRKSHLEERFQTGAAQAGFSYSQELGYYTMVPEDCPDALFTLPNQSMPPYWDFTLDFHAEQLTCQLAVPEGSLILSWTDRGKGFESSLSFRGKDGNYLIEELDGEKLQELSQPYSQVLSQLRAQGDEICQRVY